MAFVTLIVVCFVAAVVLMTERIHARRRLPGYVKRVPGPKGLPLIGSVHELPERNSWLKFHSWAEKYGPIYQVNLAGTNHVWIARDRIAHDLLSKRSAIYSDRPFIPALEQDNRTSGQYLPLMSRNEKWTRQRKFAKQIMGASEKASFYGYPELESIRLLFELMNEPSKYNVAMESFIARVTARLAWGTSTPSDELKQRARELLIGVSPSGALGNKLPFLMSLPEKLAAPKAWEARRSRTERMFFETMQQEVSNSISGKRKAAAATPKQSWTRMFLEKKMSWGFEDLEGAWLHANPNLSEVAVGMHGIAGALTIAAPMQSFCLAMCHYPQYQPTLHEEIDRVLGDRMPTFADMEDMPVLRAFIRETLRWRPPVPTGIPHELIQDDMYEGYHIPARSVIHPLEWSISRDPEVFPEPDAWNPLRWLEAKYPTYREPLSEYPTITRYSQFGYGRRMCQGMGVTEADLFVGLGSVAWLFSMAKPGTEQEESAEADVEPEESTTTAGEPGTDSSATEGESELAFFERNAERIKRSSWRQSGASLTFSAAGLGSPSPSPMHSPIAVTFDHGLANPLPAPALDEHDDAKYKFDASPMTGAAGLLTMQRNDSVMSLPGEYPGMPADPESEMSPPSPNLHARPTAQESLRTLHPTPSSKEPAKANIPTTSTASAEIDDPTMNFSTLLIAKPLPFDLKLQIRSQARAELVMKKWVEQKMQGEFAPSRVFWGGGKDTKGDAEFGWGEVFA